MRPRRITAEAILAVTSCQRPESSENARRSRDWARQRTLMASDATTQQQVDAARAASEVAAAQVAAANAQLAQARTTLEQVDIYPHLADCGDRCHDFIAAVIEQEQLLTCSETQNIADLQAHLVELLDSLDCPHLTVSVSGAFAEGRARSGRMA